MPAQRLGAKVPFLRSEKTSSDAAILAEVATEVLEQYETRLSQRFDAFCAILPTAPFLRGSALRDAYKLMQEKGFDEVLPIMRFGYPIQRSLQIRDGRVSMVWPEHMSSMSNHLEPRYHDVGQFYWMNTAAFLREKRFFLDNAGAIILPEAEAQDIDTMEDWRVAEIKFQVLRGS